MKRLILRFLKYEMSDTLIFEHIGRRGGGSDGNKQIWEIPI